MRSLINLVIKDFLLIKKYNMIMLLFTIVVPIFISYNTPEFQDNGMILYVLLSLMLTFMTYHMIAMEEMKQKGMIYVQSTPMSNGFIGLSKFVVVFIWFLIISISYVILSKIDVTKVGAIKLKEILLTCILINVFYSIYIPLTFKLGYVKLQMVSAGIIFLSPLVTGLFLQKLSNGVSIFLKIVNIPNTLFTLLSIGIIVVMISISTKATSSILNSKEY